MFEVICPKCESKRTVKSKKPWMNGEEPYYKICRSCCQIGKQKTPECKEKLSEAMKVLQTDERRYLKSQFMHSHPEIWSNNLVPGCGGGWNKGLETKTKTEETKKKISDTLKKTLSEKSELRKEQTKKTINELIEKIYNNK